MQRFRPHLRGLGHALNPFDSTAGYIVPHIAVVAAALLIAFWAGFFTRQATMPKGGGYVPHHEAPHAHVVIHQPAGATRVLGGPGVPPSFSLEKFLVRQHNQNGSEACVGQTVSTMVEILAREAKRPIPMSAGFIWNQINGLRNQPTSYTDAFRVLKDAGDAPLSAFSADGQPTDYGIWPPTSAFTAAAHFRAADYRFVNPSDWYTIEFELSHGNPLALAAPWFQSTLNHYGCPAAVISYGGGQYDRLLWWHSTAVVGYTPQGIIIQNSFGASWGCHGTAIFTWAYLRALGEAGAVMAVAHLPQLTPQAPPRFPFQFWDAFTAAKKGRHAISPYIGSGKHQTLRHAAKLWWKFGPRKAGGIVSAPQTIRPRARKHQHAVAYTTVRFQFWRLYFWKGTPWTKWQRVTPIR